MPSVPIQTSAKRYYKQLPSTSKKANIEKAKATDLLESIAIFSKSKHQTDFLPLIDSFSGKFGNFDVDFVSLGSENSF